MRRSTTLAAVAGSHRTTWGHHVFGDRRPRDPVTSVQLPARPETIAAHSRGLTKIYGQADRVVALDRVDVAFRKCHLTAIMGPWGSESRRSCTGSRCSTT